jgi:DNA-binding MarR family transcriptional regulator
MTRYTLTRILTRRIFYAWGVQGDWIDRIVERWSVLEPAMDMEPYQVTGRIARIATHVQRRQEEVFGRFGLNRGEVGVLSSLRTVGPPHRLSPTQLFKGLMLSSAGMTSRLDRLESRDLVVRRADPADRRGILVELTPKGKELVEAAVVANTAREREILAGLSDEDVESLASLLRTLLTRLEDLDGD